MYFFPAYVIYMAKSSSAKDLLQLINHAIALTEYHGGSIHLKNALHFVKNMFGNKKKEKRN